MAFKQLVPAEPCWWCSRRLMAGFTTIEAEGYPRKVHKGCKDAALGRAQFPAGVDDAHFDKRVCRRCFESDPLDWYCGAHGHCRKCSLETCNQGFIEAARRKP